MSAADLESLVEQFHLRHDTLYGYAMRGSAVELINLRVTARGITEKPDLAHGEPAAMPLEHALLKSRPAWFDGGFIDTPVYDGLKLHRGHRIEGPAIVAQPTTTILVPPDFEMSCDAYDNYLLCPKGQDVNALCAQLATGVRP